MDKFLPLIIDTVFIMLGNGCNMNCKYCLQHPLVKQPLSSDINPDIFKFLEGLSKNTNTGKLHLQFYGGEPLIYFDAIKEITEKTKDFAKPSVITNGKAITQEMVDFFNKYEFPVQVSWDGYNTLKTRGFDVFSKDSHQRDLLLQLKFLGVTSVLSALNYPIEILDAMQELSEVYAEIHNYHLRMNIDQIFDTGGVPEDLLDVDIERVISEIDFLIREFLKSRIDKDYKVKYSYEVYMGELYNSVTSFYKSRRVKDSYFCSCRNGYSVLNLDLDGNLYPCHNTSEAIGSIYDPYLKYLNKVLLSDKSLDFRKPCKQCVAYSICNGGCKLVSKESREKYYCNLKRAIILPIIKAITEFGRGD